MFVDKKVNDEQTCNFYWILKNNSVNEIYINSPYYDPGQKIPISVLNTLTYKSCYKLCNFYGINCFNYSRQLEYVEIITSYQKVTILKVILMVIPGTKGPNSKTQQKLMRESFRKKQKTKSR